MLGRSLRIGFSMCLLSCLLCAQQAERIRQILHQLDQTHTFSGVSISPNAEWITWTEKIPDEAHTKTWLLATKRANAQPQLVPKTVADYSAVWSPDSRTLAFLATTNGDDQQQVFTWQPGAAVRQITNVKGFLTAIEWSHDGSQLAFLFAENGGGGGPLTALPPQLGEIGADLHNQRIVTVAAAGGSTHAVSDGHLNVYEYDWSPDGRSFVATAAPGPADNNWWIAKLYSMDASGTGGMNQLYMPPFTQQIAIPRWSTDSRQIAFIAGIMSDEGFIGGDVFTIPAEGGAPSNLTHGRHASASSLRWNSPSQLLITDYLGGGGAISELNSESGQVKTIWQGTDSPHIAGNFPNAKVSQDGETWVAVLSSFEHPPEVFLKHAQDDWQPVTHVNSAQQSQWGKTETLTWSSDGMEVQGWLLYPQQYDPAKHYPMIVSVHGGPAGARGSVWPTTHFDMSIMSALGYFVFFPNPRGSYGQGEAFTRGNIQDFGGGDLRDILTGVDTVMGRVPVDKDRLGIAGWSYGGYMTMWTVTQTTRFHAAVAGAGIANWQSYYGQNSIDRWMIPYFGASVYNNPEAYAKSSPMTFIKQVKTPTLVLVGERDAECPAPQSFEFWHALRAMDVATKLVVYPAEGHSFHDDKDQLDRTQRSAAWFEEHLVPTAPVSVLSR